MDDLLDIARIESGNLVLDLRPMDLAEAIGDIAAVNGVLAGR